jgi:hypothetical protein
LYARLLLQYLLSEVVPSIVSAAPAPPLTDVQITGVTSDGVGYAWENISRSQTSAVNSLSGTTGVLKIYVEGTYLGSYPAVFNNGVKITTTEYKPSESVTDSTGLVIGRNFYRSFNLVNVSSGTFHAQATNYYPPNNVIGDDLYITVN